MLSVLLESFKLALPSLKIQHFFGDKVKIGKIMRACIILHNMIVEDEQDGYTQFDVSEFQQGEDHGSAHVDYTYSTDIPTNIANMMGVRIRIRDRQMHEQLKADLVEYGVNLDVMKTTIELRFLLIIVLIFIFMFFFQLCFKCYH